MTTDDGKTMTDSDFTKLLSVLRSLSDTYLSEILKAGAEEKDARKQRLQEDTMAQIRALAGNAELVVPIIRQRGKSPRGKRRRVARDRQPA